MLLEIKLTQNGMTLQNRFLFENDSPPTKEKFMEIGNIQIEAIARTLHKKKVIESENML
jgi:hypothetical protein